MSLSKSSIISQQNLTAPNPTNNGTYEFEDFRLDSKNLMLYHGGKTISLKPKVVETLVALVERRGDVISKDELMNRLWADSFVEESNLTQNIYLLRKTLGDCADGRPFIETFSRRGYRFNGEIKNPNAGELLIATHTTTQTIIEETVENRTRRNWLIPVFALIAVFGAAVFFIVRQFIPPPSSREVKSAAAAPFQTFNLKRLSDKGDVASSKVSPDGKFIAYADKKNAIWLKNTATDSNVKILPESAAIERSVKAISPDDNHIYFANWLKDKGTEVYKMPLFGGVQQKIIEDIWSDLSLSPDGKQFAFIRFDNTGDKEHALIIANADGTGERTLMTNKAEAARFGKAMPIAWSPDGSRIACLGTIKSDGKDIFKIRIFRTADGAEISLIDTDSSFRWISSIAWLPGGDNLLVVRGDASNEGQIYKYTISSGIWQKVTNDLSDYFEMSVTADGKTIITTQFEDAESLWTFPASGDLSGAKQITYGRNQIMDVTGISWTPDGKIVFASNTGGKQEIWKIDADGSNQTQLTQNCAGNDSCILPTVSPDGRYIVFQVSRNGISYIWRMDADGGNPTELCEEDGVGPFFTPDGRFLIFMRRTPAAALWQVPIEGGKADKYGKLVSAGIASISPDGKLVAYSTFSEPPYKTCIAAVTADAPEKCFAISRSFPRWTADSKAFYYLDFDYKGIWKQPLDAKGELFLEFPGEQTNNFAFSPDGKQLVVTRSRPTQDIVALTDEN